MPIYNDRYFIDLYPIISLSDYHKLPLQFLVVKSENNQYKIIDELYENPETPEVFTIGANGKWTLYKDETYIGNPIYKKSEVFRINQWLVESLGFSQDVTLSALNRDIGTHSDLLAEIKVRYSIQENPDISTLRDMVDQYNHFIIDEYMKANTVLKHHASSSATGINTTAGSIIALTVR